ncbi:hypothetical protein CHS0354_038907 [Potamilus streckersoni]|uniref:Uncharacterized protein n=1 Tax=Potamilus streckersoni TaxID=2493646 RepID=A0AAE0SR95_9BIVA|nr:hypothetical protein CHS0354_038907 [Potamilus streckersoni]
MEEWHPTTRQQACQKWKGGIPQQDSRPVNNGRVASYNKSAGLLIMEKWHPTTRQQSGILQQDSRPANNVRWASYNKTAGLQIIEE